MSSARLAITPQGSHLILTSLIFRLLHFTIRSTLISSSTVTAAGIHTPPNSMSLWANVRFNVVPALIPAPSTAVSRLHLLLIGGNGKATFVHVNSTPTRVSPAIASHGS